MRTVLSRLGGILIFAVGIFFALQAEAQTNFYTILTNGPASNRVNIVFLAEGYRTSEYTQFQVDVTNAANILLTNSPYSEYRSNFNVFAIAPPSAQSGSDHLANNTFSNTFFSSAYDMSDNYISIPSGPTGQGRVNSLLNTFMPQCDLAILLVNDSTPGGSDGGGTTAIVSRGALFTYPQYNYILTHETGHVLGGLGDEYTSPLTYPDIEEPNTTRETNRAAIKWNAWISTNTPVPTPSSSSTYLNSVGLFEGAHYHTNGWFRPKINCMMGNLSSEFCEVCKEAMVLAFYRQARPVDSFSPASTNVNTTSNITLAFSVTPLQPVTHALAVQWFTNSVQVPGAAGNSFSVLPLSLGNGTNTVSAKVFDTTALVRTDTSNLLSQSITWKVVASVPQLQLTAPRMLAGGKFSFAISGVAPSGFSIHASTNMVNWSAVSTNSLVAGQFNYTNVTATNLQRRFYRAATPPQP